MAAEGKEETQMENRLIGLFEYQKFEGNAALAAVIDEVHARYAVRDMDFQEMESVSAAGIPDLKKDRNTPRA